MAGNQASALISEYIEADLAGESPNGDFLIDVINNSMFPELTYQDLNILSDILTVIMDDIDGVTQSKIFKPAFEIEIDLRRKIQEISPLAPRKSESKYTYRLENLLHIFASLKFEHLSPQQRVKEAGKYLSDGLRRVAKKKGIIVQDSKNKNKE